MGFINRIVGGVEHPIKKRVRLQTDVITQKRRRHALGKGFPPEPVMAINFFQQPGLTNVAKVMKVFEVTSTYSITLIRRLYRYV